MWEIVSVRRIVDICGICTAFQNQYPPDFVFPGESHDFYELLIVLSGSIGVTAGSDSFVLNSGTAILHPPMEFHSFHATKGTSPQIAVFSFTAEEMPFFDRRIFLLSEDNRVRVHRILQILSEAATFHHLRITGIKEKMERHMQEALCELELLILKLNEVSDTERMMDVMPGSRNYRRALAVLDANIREPLSLDELAVLCRMSSSLLKKTFSRYAGVGVMAFFRAQKIHAAIPMLRNGQSVSDTAQYFGFSDAGYFSTVFRKVTGHTPGYYRNH